MVSNLKMITQIMEIKFINYFDIMVIIQFIDSFFL